MIKIVTFNLRCDTPEDAVHRWHYRKGLVLDRLETEMPDLIGFQEAQPGMTDFLSAHMPEYLFVGCGREADFSGENNAIALRRDRFELMALDTFWLSDTPFVPGSRYEIQSPCPRVCTHTMLRDRAGNRLIHYYNTHLDHRSDPAREKGAQAILKRMADDLSRWDAPVLLTGDMNAHPDTLPIRAFAAFLTDQTPSMPSFHGFGRREPVQIDYIFSRGFEAAQPPVAWTERPYDQYLSDHHALCAYLDIK